MGTGVPFGVASARELAARTCQETFIQIGSGGILPPDKWFMRIAHGLWGSTKPGAWIRSLTGLPERTCRSAASGDTDPSGPMLYALLRGEQGERVLDAIMDGAPSDWHRDLQRAKRIAQAIAAVE